MHIPRDILHQTAALLGVAQQQHRCAHIDKGMRARK